MTPTEALDAGRSIRSELHRNRAYGGAEDARGNPGVSRLFDARKAGEMRFILGFVVVFFGGGLGAALRHGVNLAAARMMGTTFPYGTLFINVLGSLCMGLIAEYFALKSGLSQRWLLFITTGILGGFTTFSTFSLDTALLYERGQIGAAGLYVIASVAIGIGALFTGMAIVRALV